MNSPSESAPEKKESDVSELEKNWKKLEMVWMRILKRS